MQLPNQNVLAWVALCAVALHGTAMVLLHVLVPDVDPTTDMVSAYLRSEYAALSRFTFLVLGCALASLGLALRSHLSVGMFPRIAAILLLVAIVGFVGVASAPSAARYFGIPTQPATVLSILILSIALRRDPRWSSIGALLVLIGGALTAIFVLTVVLGTLVSFGLGGLANRLVLVLIYVWVVLIAKGLLMPKRDVGASAA